jgi:hypothetical protein
MAIPVALACCAGPAAAQSVQRFRLPSCGYGFDVPAGWVATAEPGGCAARVRPADFERRVRETRGVDVFTVTVSVSTGHFLAVAAESGFDFVDDEWVTVGRQGMTEPARTERVGLWWGLRGTAMVGCFGDEGYAGLCEIVRAVMRDAQGNILTIDGGPQAEDVVEIVLRTVTAPPP